MSRENCKICKNIFPLQFLLLIIRIDNPCYNNSVKVFQKRGETKMDVNASDVMSNVEKKEQQKQPAMVSVAFRCRKSEFDEFKSVCHARGVSASAVIREFMRNAVAQAKENQ